MKSLSVGRRTPPKFLRVFTSFALLTLLCAGSVHGQESPQVLTDRARIIAGLPPLQREHWGLWEQIFRAATGRNPQPQEKLGLAWILDRPTTNHGPNLFFGHERARLESFFATHLGRARNTQRLFYPLAGADVFWPLLMFPQLNRMVMIGLEEPGQLLDPARLGPAQTLGAIRAMIPATDEQLAFGYFRTDSMKEELGAVGGVVNVMLAGIVASGNSILAVRHVEVDPQGQVVVGATGTNLTGVQIDFIRPNRQTGSLVYLKVRLGDNLIFARSPFLNFLDREQFETLYLKAASHVLQLPQLARTAEAFRDRVANVIQSDNGIFHRMFEEQGPLWSLRLFGVYGIPRPPFSSRVHPELRSTYWGALCQSSQARSLGALNMFLGHWEMGTCGAPRTPFASVEWQGVIPFRYDYNARPGVFPPGATQVPQAFYWGTLQIYERVR